MTVPPRLWDLALPAMALIAVVVLLNLGSDPSILAAIILVAVLGVWLALRLLTGVVQFLFGGSVIARLLAFGVAFWVFPEMVIAPFQVARELVRYVSQNVPVVTAAWPLIKSADPQVLGLIPKLVDGALAASDLPLRRMILGFVTWAVAGHFLSALVTHANALGETTRSTGDRIQSVATAATSSLVAGVRRIPAGFWPGSTVVIMLAIGIYLILGAIATIPYLSQQSTSVEEMSARLATTLNGIQRSEMQFTSRHPVNLPDGDPLGAMKAFVKTPTAPSPAPAVPEPPRPAVTPARLDEAQPRAPATAPLAAFEATVREGLTRTIDESERFRKSARDVWARLRRETWETESKLRPNLEAQFTANLPSLRGTGEQTQFLDTIRSSYAAELDQIDRHLDFCWNAVQRVDEQVESDASATIARVRQMRTEFGNHDDSFFDVRLASTLANSVADTPPLLASVDPFCDTYMVSFVPNLPERGAGWGPLARIFDWLLATDSVDVVVIIGMLGAGLFGSAVGTFVTSRVRRRGGVVGEGAMSHVIRSFAATMVVYLGLKTGVAFAAVGNPDPDPYLMLFLCFIGTVYSDDVWDWAKRTGEGYWSTGKRTDGKSSTPDLPPPG